MVTTFVAKLVQRVVPRSQYNNMIINQASMVLGNCQATVLTDYGSYRP